MKKLIFYFLLILVFVRCDQPGNHNNGDQEIVIFTMNDMHGQIENFAKVKHIVDHESLPAIVVSAGDIFSGNPVVDSYEEKGFPIIDLMNRVGVDVSAIGNHEYDYGDAQLANRMNQANFPFICANVNSENSAVPQPPAYVSLMVGEVKITFLGLVETNGSDNETIPSTHPWRVADFTFQRPESVVDSYKDLKATENADLFIAVTHIGHDGGNYVLGDYQLAENFPYFDMIIGGHSHREIDTVVNGIPVFQSGSYLHKLGKIVVKLSNHEVTSVEFSLIDLDAYTGQDKEIADLVAAYNDQPYLTEVVGYAHGYHTRAEVGCFYTAALHDKMQVDLAFQNTGGVRSDIDNGDITKRDIYEVSPFNNGTVIYQMTIAEVKAFLMGSGSGFYYNGLDITQNGSTIIIKDLAGTILDDATAIQVGVNDYIPAVHATYFPSQGAIQPLSAAETLIAYLQDINDQVDFVGCNNYFRYQ